MIPHWTVSSSWLFAQNELLTNNNDAFVENELAVVAETRSNQKSGAVTRHSSDESRIQETQSWIMRALDVMLDDVKRR